MTLIVGVLAVLHLHSEIRSLEKDPKFREGRTYLHASKFEAAIEVFRKILKDFPESSPLRMELAEAMFRSGDRLGAVDVLRQGAVLQKKEQEKSGLINRARMLARQFLSNDEYQIYQDALNAMIASRWKDALEHLNRINARKSPHAEVLTRIGQIRIIQDERKEALAVLQEAVRLLPDDPSLLLWYGRALHVNGKFSEAIPVLREVVRRLPTSEQAPVWLADALAGVGLMSEAQEVLNRDIQMNSWHVYSLSLLAKFQATGPLKSFTSSLKAAQRNLLNAKKRLTMHEKNTSWRHEGELGFPTTRPSEAPLQIEKQLKEIREKLQSARS